MDESKKIQESIILENFRKHFQEFPKGKLIKSESPDFILKTSPKYSIGIEITSLPSLSYSITKESISTFSHDLQSSIAKKDEKLSSYRKKKANEYLLIVFADTISSQGINLNNHIDKLSFSSGFDRVFLFCLFDGIIWEVK